MVKEILIVCVLLLSIPIGLLVAWLCRDELVAEKRWFKVIMVASAIIALVMLFFGNFVVVLTMIFFFIITLVSYIKSFDVKWTKRKL